MAIEKQRLHLKSALSVLMYFTIAFGIVPYSAVAYFKHNIIKLSVFGNVWALINVINNVIQHHFASTRFLLSDKQETGTLTNIIGLVIMYMEPVMCVMYFSYPNVRLAHSIHRNVEKFL